MNCPTCSHPLTVEKASVRNGVQWWRAKCGHVAEHPKSTVLIGGGTSPDDAAKCYLDRVARNEAIAARRAKNAADKEAGVRLESAKAEDAKMRAIRSTANAVGAKCPACGLPLRVFEDWARNEGVRTGERVWYAACPNYSRKQKCSYRNSRILGRSPEEAVQRWLDLEVKTRPVPPPAPRAENPGMISDNYAYPTCRCGLRIFDGAATCPQCVLPSWHYARTGASSSGIEWGRGGSGDV